jgi:type IV pilus assembly protein PilW
MNTHTLMPKRWRTPSRHQRGVGLVELMVAMAIGAVLILGAMQMYVDSRNAYTVNETEARLQENARYALSVMEPDIRMANYWGLLKGSVGLSGGVPQTAPAAVVLGGASAAACGANYSVDVQTTLEGNNDAYALGCAAWHNKPVTSADTLTVRRASLTQSTIPAATIGPLRVCSTRIFAGLVNDVTTCTIPPSGEVHDLVVHAYYVDQDSAQINGLPTLFRKSLNVTPNFQDDEILPGVEDMQVQFGIDPTGNGIATQYVDAIGPAVLPAASQIVSVRVWLLVRAEAPEQGFVDNRTYAYGNRLLANGTTNNLNSGGAAGKAYRPADQFRRLLISRSVMLRNALGT